MKFSRFILILLYHDIIYYWIFYFICWRLDIIILIRNRFLRFIYRIWKRADSFFKEIQLIEFLKDMNRRANPTEMFLWHRKNYEINLERLDTNCINRLKRLPCIINGMPCCFVWHWFLIGRKDLSAWCFTIYWGSWHAARAVMYSAWHTKRWNWHCFQCSVWIQSSGVIFQNVKFLQEWSLQWIFILVNVFNLNFTSALVGEQPEAPAAEHWVSMHDWHSVLLLGLATPAQGPKSSTLGISPSKPHSFKAFSWRQTKPNMFIVKIMIAIQWSKCILERIFWFKTYSSWIDFNVFFFYERKNTKSSKFAGLLMSKSRPTSSLTQLMQS